MRKLKIRDSEEEKRRKKKKKKKEKKKRELNTSSSPKKLKKKEKKKYEKTRCAYIYPADHKRAGKRCKRNATKNGSSSLCKKHGAIVKVGTMDLTGITNVIKYDPKYCMEAIFMAKEGYSKTEIAAAFKVSSGTLLDWAERYKDFYEAMEIAAALNESWWIKEGKNNLNNTRFQTPLYKFLTSNIMGWSDKMETNNRNLSIHGVLKVPGALDNDEWEKMAEEENERVQAAYGDGDIMDAETVDA